MKRVYILTEGGTTCGFGHLTRCISLYQAFKHVDIQPVMILNAESKISPILDEINYQLVDWVSDISYTLDLISGAEIVVVDSYLASKEQMEQIAESVILAAFIDDNNRLDYPKGAVINGLLYADELGYRENEGHSYLLGRNYVLLREEFARAEVISLNKQVKSLLLCLGGSNQDKHLRKIISVLSKQYPDITKYILVSQNSTFINQEYDDKSIVLQGLSSSGIVNLMKKVDIAITAGGQFLLELISLGVPCVVTSVAENQIRNINSIQDREAIRYIGKIDSIDLVDRIVEAVDFLTDIETRITFQNKGLNLFNKRGSIEVVRALVRGVDNC